MIRQPLITLIGRNVGHILSGIYMYIMLTYETLSSPAEELDEQFTLIENIPFPVASVQWHRLRKDLSSSWPRTGSVHIHVYIISRKCFWSTYFGLILLMYVHAIQVIPTPEPGKYLRSRKDDCWIVRFHQLLCLLGGFEQAANRLVNVYSL